MTDIDKLKEALDLVERMKARAIAAVSKAPYWKWVDNDEWARLSVEGDEAQLSFFKVETYYDSTSVEPETVKFPSALLMMPDTAFEAWKESQMARHRKAEEARAAEKVLQKEMQERAALAALKAKYEG